MANQSGITILEKREEEKQTTYFLLEDGIVKLARLYVVTTDKRQCAENKRTMKLLSRVTKEVKEPLSKSKQLERQRLQEHKDILRKRIAAQNAYADKQRQKERSP